jgi:hypothetical protein
MKHTKERRTKNKNADPYLNCCKIDERTKILNCILLFEICLSIVVYNKIKFFQRKSMMSILLFLSCASDIKIAPHKDSGILYGLELSPQNYDFIELLNQSSHHFDFSLLAHEKTTLQEINLLQPNTEDIQWSVESFLQPPVTISVGSKIIFSVHVSPNTTGRFTQELEILSTKEDWLVELEIESIRQ